jgi:hypothetical protein
MISRKRPKKEEEPAATSALNTSKRQVSESEKLGHSSIKSTDSGLSDPDRDSKRNLIYDTESFKEEP